MTFQFDGKLDRPKVVDTERDIELFQIPAAHPLEKSCFFVRASGSEHIVTREATNEEVQSERLCWIANGRKTLENNDLIVGGWFTWKESSRKIAEHERGIEFPEQVTDSLTIQVSSCNSMLGPKGDRTAFCRVDGFSKKESLEIFAETQEALLDLAYRRAPSPEFRRRIHMSCEWSPSITAWLEESPN